MKTIFTIMSAVLMTCLTSLPKANTIGDKTINYQLFTLSGYNKALPNYSADSWLVFQSNWKTDGTKAELVDATNEVASLIVNGGEYDNEYAWVYKPLLSTGVNRATIFLYPDPSMQDAANLSALQSQLTTVITKATINNGGVVTKVTSNAGNIGTLSLQITAQY